MPRRPPGDSESESPGTTPLCSESGTAMILPASSARPESKSRRLKARPGGLPLSAAGAAAALPGELVPSSSRTPDLSLRQNLGPHGGEWSHAIENPRVMLDWPIVLTKVETGPGNLTF
jgi:hypothetical protein